MADENQLFRELMTERFSRTTDMEVVAEAGESLEILDKVSLIQTDIVLTEVVSPHLNGIEVTKSLQKKLPSVKVVALTTLSEKNIIKSMLEANAWGGQQWLRDAWSIRRYQTVKELMIYHWGHSFYIHGLYHTLM